VEITEDVRVVRLDVAADDLPPVAKIYSRDRMFAPHTAAVTVHGTTGEVIAVNLHGPIVNPTGTTHASQRGEWHWRFGEYGAYYGEPQPWPDERPATDTQPAIVRPPAARAVVDYVRQYLATGVAGGLTVEGQIEAEYVGLLMALVQEGHPGVADTATAGFTRAIRVDLDHNNYLVIADANGPLPEHRSDLTEWYVALWNRAYTSVIAASGYPNDIDVTVLARRILAVTQPNTPSAGE
jgi:hypothetical protein